MKTEDADRERHMRALAARLLFGVQKQGNLFTLTRDVDVSNIVRHEGLTLDQAEEVLNTWKLHGYHGG